MAVGLGGSLHRWRQYRGGVNEGTFVEQDPRPDEDAWEAYLNFVRPLLNASDETGLENAELSQLESVLGSPLPFEIGLLLVMGVPDTFPWRNWKGDQADQLREWNEQVSTSLKLDPDDFNSAPKLLPIYGNVAVPLSPAEDASPLFRIEPSGVTLAGLDLGDWLHKEFDMPLPWWPDNTPSNVPFWSDRVS